MKKDSGEFNNVTGKGVSNCTSAFVPTMGWIRVGNYVTIAGRVQVSVPSIGLVQFTIPTPLPTDFLNTMGTGGNFSDNCGNSGIFEVSNANNLIFTFTNEDDNYSDFMFSGMFKISHEN
jgi:hypothetical protein